MVSLGVSIRCTGSRCVNVLPVAYRSPFSTDGSTTDDNELTLRANPDFPEHLFSREAQDLMRRLFTPDHDRRLGSGPCGWEQVMSHPFFASVDWELMEAGALPAPVIPAYVMPLNLKQPPPKLAGHRQRGTGKGDSSVRTGNSRCIDAYHLTTCATTCSHLSSELIVDAPHPYLTTSASAVL